MLRTDFRTKVDQKIHEQATLDENSRFGCYLLVNPNLTKPSYLNILEFQRVSITRYCTGSHNLKIELDRQPPKVEREERLCKCDTGVQTLKYCIIECPLLLEAREVHQIQDIVNGVANVDFLMEMERLLGVLLITPKDPKGPQRTPKDPQMTT